MCAITFVARQGEAPTVEALALSQANVLADAQQHRGPDERGQLTATGTPAGTITLIVDRLALTGGTAGHQPLALDDPRNGRAGRYWLALNGQVTNFRALAATLSLPPDHAAWQSDTAAVGAWLAGRGTLEGLPHLEGMFALIWVDHQAQTITLARDRFGIKPLWYGSMGPGSWVVTSERPALMPAPAPDLLALTHLLAYRYLPWGSFPEGSPTPRPLAPGHYLTLPFAGLHTRHLESVPIEPIRLRFHHTVPPSTPPGVAFIEALEASVSAHLKQSGPDEPIGIMLSGGLDSATMATLAARQARSLNRRLVALTLEGLGADSAGARRLSLRLGIPLITVLQPTDDAELLRCVTHLAAEPILDPGAYLTWLLAARARAEGIRILFSGAGADEWLGGYRRHRAYWLIGQARKRLSSTTLPWLGRLIRGRVGEALTRHDPINRIDTLSALPLWPGAPARPPRATGHTDTSAAPLPYPTDDPLHLMLAHERATYLCWDVLSMTDRAASAHGVETRLPFLTPEVGSAAASVLRSQGLRPGKAVLAAFLDREGLLGLLPSGKRGFGPLRLPASAIDKARALLDPGHPLMAHGLSHYAPPEAWRRWVTSAGPVRGPYSILTLQAYSDRMISPPGSVAGG